MLHKSKQNCGLYMMIFTDLEIGEAMCGQFDAGKVAFAQNHAVHGVLADGLNLATHDGVCLQEKRTDYLR